MNRNHYLHLQYGLCVAACLAAAAVAGCGGDGSADDALGGVRPNADQGFSASGGELGAALAADAHLLDDCL
jgi:hypothetical protein